MNIFTKLILVAVVVGGGAFYSGIKYEQAKIASRGGTFAALGGTGGLRGRNGQGGAQFNGTFGQVIDKSDSSITVKLMDGGSRIVFVSDSTPVMKSVSGSSADITVGTNVAVTGASNADGSVTAEQVQIRPAIPSPTPVKK